MSSTCANIQIHRFFNLLCCAISNQEQKESIFIGIKPEEWQELMDLCAEQGVLAVCYEPLEKFSIRPPVDYMLEWYGEKMNIETIYYHNLNTFNEFTEKWLAAGIRTMVFKGIAHSRYYPQPAHREFGDFDCYTFAIGNDCNNIDSNFEKSNRIAAELGAKVDDSWYKHSKIQYNELTIENHRFFTAVRSNKDAKSLNEYIVNNLGNGTHLNKLGDTEILLPPTEVEGLFLIHHAMRHFLEEGIKIRHFCDWACWINENQKRINWREFYQKCILFHMDGFVDILNNIACRYFCINTSNFRYNEKLNRLADRVIEHTLNVDSSIHNKGKGRWYERLHLIINAFRYSWKYTDVAHYSMAYYLWSYVKGFLNREEED